MAEPDRPDADAPAAADRAPLFRDTLGWYLGVSAFWFATSFKWFLLFLLLPGEVSRFVPDRAKNGAWGRVVALGAVEAMIGPAVMGYLSDRTRSRWGRRRPYIALGAGLTALALLYLRGANSLTALMIGYLLLQISDDIGTGPYAAIVPDVVPEEKRGKASGLLGMLQLAAQVVAVATGLALGNVGSIYIAIAVVNVVCALIVLRTVRERRADAPPPPASRPRAAESPRPGFGALLARGAREWAAPWRSRDFRWVWFTRFLVALGFYLVTNYVTNYLKDSVRVFSLFGLTTLKDARMAALVAALMISVFGGVGAVLGGRAADKIGRKRVIVLAGWVMFAALVPFALFPNYSLLVLLAVAFGAGYGAYTSASWALAADVLPSKEDAAKDMGIWQMSVATPQVFSGFAGLAIDAGNRANGGLGYTLAYLFAAGAFLAGALLVTRVRAST